MPLVGAEKVKSAASEKARELAAALAGAAQGAEPVYQLRSPLSKDWADTPKPLHMTDDGYGQWYEVSEERYRAAVQAGTHKHRVLYAQPPAAQGAEPVGDGTIEFTLRAMARNYTDGHAWDHLDKAACLRAADEIRRLQSASPQPTGTSQESQHG